MGTQYRRQKLKQLSSGQFLGPHSPTVSIHQKNQQQILEEQVKDQQQQEKKGARRYGLDNVSSDDDVLMQDTDMDVDNEDYHHKNKRQKISSITTEQQSFQLHQEYRQVKIERLNEQWRNHFQTQQSQILQMEQCLAQKLQMEMMQKQQTFLPIPSKDDPQVQREYMLIQEQLRDRQRQDEQRQLNMLKALEEQRKKEQEEQQRLIQEQIRKEEEEKQKNLERIRVMQEQKRKEEEEKQKQQEYKQKQEQEKQKNLEQIRAMQEQKRKEQEQLKKIEQQKKTSFVSETVQQKVTDSIVLIAQKSALEEEVKGVEMLQQVREQIKNWGSSGSQNSRQKTSIGKNMTTEVSQISATTSQVRRKSQDLIKAVNSYNGPARTCAYYQIAAKIILQCESQVARLPSFVFPLAEVACTLGVCYPDFLQILLALLREKCMLVVPKYMVLVSQDADSSCKKDFLLRLGYVTKRVGLEEQMESSDEYIDRMKGYMRLYAALMQASNKDNHYGIDNAWRWLARALNSTPPSRALAVSLFSILQVTGFSLNQKYKAQFQKLLVTIQEQLIPKLQAKHDDDLNSIIVNISSFCSSREYLRPPAGKNMPFKDESQDVKA